MNIRRKLYLGFAIVLAFVITAQVISLVNLASIDAAFQDFERVQLKLAILADDIRYYDATLTDAVRAIIIDPQDKTHVERYNRDAEALDKALIDAEALATTAEDKQIFAAIAKDNVRMVEIERELIDKPDLLKAVEYYRGEYGQLKTSYANQVGLFYQHQQAAQQSQEDAIISRIGVMSASNIALGVVFILASIAVAIILSRNITLPLTQLTRAAQRVSDGDLTQRVSVTSKDEIGSLAQTFNSMSNNLQTTMASQVAKEYIEKVINRYNSFVSRVTEGDLSVRLNFSDQDEQQSNEDLHQLGLNLNKMVESLAVMTQSIRETAVSITSVSAEILAATTQQIASATEQDITVTQTMSTVEEIRVTVAQAAQRAQSVANASQQSIQVSRTGQNAVSDTIEGMSVLRQRVEGIAETILLLAERTTQIDDIISAVNEISDQSKLLALNASIEAARAGQEGKGFAVVATEVRHLSEQSRDATSKVRAILKEIQQATNNAVMVTEEGSKGAETGMSLVQRAGEAIHELAQTIEEAAQAALQIAASTHQQTTGMDQLAIAMVAIKQASSQTAASTREAERSAKDLNAMAHQMQQAVAIYRL